LIERRIFRHLVCEVPVTIQLWTCFHFFLILPNVIGVPRLRPARPVRSGGRDGWRRCAVAPYSAPWLSFQDLYDFDSTCIARSNKRPFLIFTNKRQARSRQSADAIHQNIV